ncbi:LamG domain-containing protein [Curtobacterium sp. Csp1]|uniref:LamG domain-containing protein n=1 Tax=Curtobacterium sp. Csp1 TaxID=2495429 RepID=UPI00159A9BD1|nr:LamG domain-containing protein [Curtobacterium sp. Csp1]QKS18844.1 LamG domain-containing protein [Curtobacterium sp. Csp1]
MTPMSLRNGRSVAAALGLALAMLLVLIGLNPTLSAFTATVSNSSNTAGTATYFTCAAAATADKTALFAYPLNDADGSSSATDISGNRANGAYQGGMSSQQIPPIACPRDPGGAYVLNGSSSYVYAPTAYNNPTTFTEEVWFKTTSAGGTIMGFGSQRTGESPSNDRKIYMDTNGQVHFAIYQPGAAKQILTSPKSYADGQWHLVDATLSPTAGTRLYLDGVLVDSSSSATTPQAYTGYWRIGYDKLRDWTNANPYFTGSMRYAAVYSTALTQEQINNHYTAGR